MGTTGWLGEQPEEPQAGGFAGFILANRAPQGEGRTVEDVLARAAQARDREPEPYDDDDRQAALVTRGYRPGLVQELAQRLGDATAELEAERDKVEAGKRRAAHVMRMHANGQIRAWDIPGALGDEGDPSRVAQLERRAESLGRQLAEVQDMITPPERHQPGPLEQATSRAHQAFLDATRAKLAEAQAARPAPPPFAGRGSGAAGAEHCEVCAEARRMEAARDSEDLDPYPPGAVITTGYREIAR